MFYIQPDECVNCGLCESICPVDAIRKISEVTEQEKPYVAVNKEFFEDEVTGWGMPDGWTKEYTTTQDHPMVAEFKVKE